MFKLIFFIYILCNRNIAHAPSNEIWVHYNDQLFSFEQNILEALKISNVKDLIDIVKPSLRTSVENVSEKVITLRRGEDEFLNSETPISGLYNTVNQALHVVVCKHNIQL